MLRAAPLVLVVALVACKKSQPAAEDAAPPSASGAAAKAEGVAEQDIKRVIRESRPTMEKCYDDAAAKKPELDGKVTLLFAVNADGSVDKQRAGLGGDVGGEEFAKCVLDVVVALKFPPAKAPTDVQFPIDLKKRTDAGVAPKPDAGG